MANMCDAANAGSVSLGIVSAAVDNGPDVSSASINSGVCESCGSGLPLAATT